MTILDTRPDSSEYAPWIDGYVNATDKALATANITSVLALLEAQVAEVRAMLASTTTDQAQHAYAAGKWTLAESWLHVADTERVFGYRTLRIARGDKTALPGFEQDEWVPESRASQRAWSDILTEVEAVRSSTLALVRSLDETAVQQTGTASGKSISVRALVWMTAGHFAHHIEITKTRYLATA